MSHFKPGKAPEALYKKYNIPKERPIVLYVGRVDPEKNVGMVVAAFSLVLQKVPEAVLVVVGDGVDKARLIKETAKMGISNSVRFLGRVVGEDLYEIYKMGWVFVTASEIETQGIVLIEAAASGLPLVAVNAGAVNEICVNNENGFLIEIKINGNRVMIPKLQVMISEAVMKILEDTKLRERFSVNSVKFAQKHDFKNTLDSFINIYQRVMILHNEVK